MATSPPAYVILIFSLIGSALSYFVIPCGVECEYLSNQLRLACSGRTLTCIPKPCCLERTRFVDLSNNNLTSIPQRSFQSFPNLNSLDLKLNSIQQVFPLAFKGLRYLQTLDLKDNKITTLRAGVFEGLLNLRSLTLSRNRISDIQPGTFRLLPNLKNLKLQHNLLQVVYLDTFAQLNELVTLDLDSNVIHTTYQESFSALVNLESLSLANNNIATLPEILSNLNQLGHFNLRGNPLYCDCSLEFLRRWFSDHGDEARRKSGVCSQPSILEGRLLASLTTELLCRHLAESSYSFQSNVGQSYTELSESLHIESTTASAQEDINSNAMKTTSSVTSSPGHRADVQKTTLPFHVYKHADKVTMRQAAAEDTLNQVMSDATTASFLTSTIDPRVTRIIAELEPSFKKAATITKKPMSKFQNVRGRSLHGVRSESLQQESFYALTTHPTVSTPVHEGSSGTQRGDGDSFQDSADRPTQDEPYTGDSGAVTNRVKSIRKSSATESSAESKGYTNTHISDITGQNESAMSNASSSEESLEQTDIELSAGDPSSDVSSISEMDKSKLYAPKSEPLIGELPDISETDLTAERIHSGFVTEVSYAGKTTNNYPELDSDIVINDSSRVNSVRTAISGEFIVLECPMETAVPFINYLSNYETKWLSPSGQWIEEHMQRFSITGDGGLSIWSVSPSDHGTYRCVRAQLMGDPEIASVLLRVSCPCQQVPEMTYFTKQPSVMASAATPTVKPRTNRVSREEVDRGRLHGKNEVSCTHMPIAVAVLITFQVTVAMCIITFCAFLSWRSARNSTPDTRPRPESFLERPRTVSEVNFYDRDVPSTLRLRPDVPTIVYESTGDEKPEEAHENNSESDSALSSSGSQRNSAVGDTDMYVNAGHSSLRRDTDTYADLDPNSRSRHDTYSSLHLQDQESE